MIQLKYIPHHVRWVIDQTLNPAITKLITCSYLFRVLIAGLLYALVCLYLFGLVVLAVKRVQPTPVQYVFLISSFDLFIGQPFLDIGSVMEVVYRSVLWKVCSLSGGAIFAVIWRGLFVQVHVLYNMDHTKPRICCHLINHEICSERSLEELQGGFLNELDGCQLTL